jgi:hypothetical protein
MYNDELLNKYHSEITNERNDGWWKKHYQELFDKRVEELKKAQEKHNEHNVESN